MMPARDHVVIAAILGLVASYAAAAFLPLFSQNVPLPWIVAANIVPVALFAFLHGAILYRRAILVFAGICLVVGNAVENLGVLTGFPFGHYYFTAAMGPKLLLVPVLMGPAYLGMGYLAWMMAQIILHVDRSEASLAGSRIITLPVAASFLMVAWDLTMDPALSTIGHSWIWIQGGPYFGVPLSNFFGWFLTNYIIYQMFALYLRRAFFVPRPQQAGYWRVAVIMYAIAAAGAIVRAVPASQALVSDASGHQWKLSDINRTCALASIFTMGAFVTLAFVRLAGRSSATQGTPESTAGVLEDLNQQPEFALESRSGETP
jgi:putative membrane protein